MLLPAVCPWYALHRGIKRLFRPISSMGGGSCIPLSISSPHAQLQSHLCVGQETPGHPLAALGFPFEPSHPKDPHTTATSAWVIYGRRSPTLDPLDCSASPDPAAAPSLEEKGGSGEKVGMTDVLGGSQASPVAPAQQHPGRTGSGHLLFWGINC